MFIVEFFKSFNIPKELACYEKLFEEKQKVINRNMNTTKNPKKYPKKDIDYIYRLLENKN